MILKKPKFWDFKKPNFFAYLLYPFTIFVEINNIISSLIPKKKFTEIKTLCVGNLYIGGTGKTPTSLLLYNLLNKMNINPVTAKKFYNNQMDEQKLLKDNSNFISLTDRKKIVKKAIEMKFDMIIFDDGLQEKWIDYDIKFACFDSEKWIGNGHLIPSGPLREKIDTIKGFMPLHEGKALMKWAKKFSKLGPILEIGSYCGKSAIFLSHGAFINEQLVYTIDHHKGSEEHQINEEYFDKSTYDYEKESVNTLPFLIKNINAFKAHNIVPIIGKSIQISKNWNEQLGMVFIDGGHSYDSANSDYLNWNSKIISKNTTI